MVIFHSYVITDLVGGIPIPLKKQESQWEGLSQYIMENTKCLKPPTSNYITDLTIQSMSDDKGCRFDWPRKKWMWLMIRCSWFISLSWLGSSNIVMCMYICQIYNYIQSVGWVKIRHQQTQLGGLFLFFYLRKHMGVTYRAGMSPTNCWCVSGNVTNIFELEGLGSSAIHILYIDLG